MVSSLVHSSDKRVNLSRNNGLPGSHHFGLVKGICVGRIVRRADESVRADGRMQGVVETFRKVETCVVQQITLIPSFPPDNLTSGILQHLFRHLWDS